MVLPYGTGDLYHRYRPQKFSEIAGHNSVVRSIKNALIADNPSQSYMLSGASGTGKTTTARIMALSLNCDSRTEEGEPCLECKSCKSIMSRKCMDVIEKNSAEHRGIDAVREISKTMSLMPMQARNKVYILDEFHQMTKEAQTSLLKLVEEAPRNVFIILCTTHPSKVLPTIKNRCQQFTFKSLPKQEIIGLLEEVTTYEGRILTKPMLEVIADSSQGSPRKSLVILQQVFQLREVTIDSVKDIINTEVSDPDIMELVFSCGTKKWQDTMTIYKKVKSSGAPAIGMVMAGFIRNQLIGATNKASADKLSQQLKLFVVPFDDSKLGENQLVSALYNYHVLATGGRGRF